MASTHAPGDAPTDLRFVGPATAAVIRAAPFDAEDVAARRVSYRMLVEAGVNPGVAERLRRAHSLVWDFEFRGGEALRERAARVRGLSPDEREWILASVRSENGHADVAEAKPIPEADATEFEDVDEWADALERRLDPP